MKIRQAREICAAGFSNSLVVFDLRNYRSFILNDTAALVWNFCKKSRDLNQIAKFLNTKYQIDLVRAKRDTTKLIKKLEKRNLIVSHR
jgi:hypothetical protein